MTGMKEGAGEDPFSESDGSDTTRSSEPSAESEVDRRPDDSSATPGRQVRTERIPYKFRRDGVQDGRNRTPLFLQAETKRQERETLRELEERFDTAVSKTDLREALVKVGMNHLEEVESQLEQWGYGMTFDE